MTSPDDAGGRLPKLDPSKLREVLDKFDFGKFQHTENCHKIMVGGIRDCECDPPRRLEEKWICADDCPVKGKP